MTPLARIDRWRRWSVTVLGALFCGVIIGTIAVIRPELTTLDLLQKPVPILLALGLTGYGGWLARSALSTERITRIALWCLAGTVVIGSFATWEMSLDLAEGESVAETIQILLRGGTEGALVGGLVGYYDARRREQHQKTERANRAITASIDGIALLDEDGRYTEINQAHAEVYGYDRPEDFIGESWRMCYTDAERALIEEEVFPALLEDGHWRGELTGKRRDGRTFPQELTLTASDDGSMVCIVRGITERKAREQELEQYEAIVRALPDVVYTLDADGDILSLNRDPTKTGYASDQLIGENVSAIMDEDDIATARDVIRELLTDDDCEKVTYELNINTRDGTRIPYENHVALLPRDDDGGFRGTVGVMRDITERKRREQQLHTLHQATRDMMSAATRQEVAEVAAEPGDDILDVPVNIHLYDEDADGLAPTAISPKTREVLGDPPTIRAGEGIAWRVFESGDPEIYEDVRTAPGILNPETPIRSECCLPLGDHGVLLAASTTVDAFDESDISVLKILAANVETAFDRARREQKLQRRKRELQHQNDRLDEFANMVSHDLRNPLNVAMGRLDLARETGDDEHFKATADAQSRMEGIIEDVLTVAREGDAVGDKEPVELATVARRAWNNVETGPASFQCDTDQEIEVDASRVGQLFENLFRNAVEHGSTSNRNAERSDDAVEHGSTSPGSQARQDAVEYGGEEVTVRVGWLAERTGFYVEDTGPGIPPEEQKSVLESGYTTDTEGTGFGLAIVEEIAVAHGWEIGVTDGAEGGARFEVTTAQGDR